MLAAAIVVIGVLLARLGGHPPATIDLLATGVHTWVVDAHTGGLHDAARPLKLSVVRDGVKKSAALSESPYDTTRASEESIVRVTCLAWVALPEATESDSGPAVLNIALAWRTGTGGMIANSQPIQVEILDYQRSPDEMVFVGAFDDESPESMAMTLFAFHYSARDGESARMRTIEIRIDPAEP